MKPRKSERVKTLKMHLITPFLAAIPLVASAQMNNNHVTVLLNNILDPQQMTAAMQSDPSFVTWMGNSYVPQPDPTATASADPTTLSLDEETVTAFSTALANTVATTSNAMFMAASDSAARNIGTQPYVLNFVGAQKDTTAAGVVALKAVITGIIASDVPYQLTSTGKKIVPLTAASLSITSEFARFTLQEYMKGYLINKKGFTEYAAGWASFAVAQVLGVAMTPVWTYVTQIGIAPHFNATTTKRRTLLHKVYSDAKNYYNAMFAYNSYMNEFQATQYSPYYTDAQNSLTAASGYNSDYFIKVSNLSNYESVAFPSLTPTSAYNIESLTADPYPGYATQATTPPDYSLIFDSIYNSLISQCDAVSNAADQSLSVTCPSGSSYYRTRIYLKPLQQDANGNVTVQEFHVNARGDAALFATSTINAKNINTANYH